MAESISCPLSRAVSAVSDELEARDSVLIRWCCDRIDGETSEFLVFAVGKEVIVELGPGGASVGGDQMVLARPFSSKDLKRRRCPDTDRAACTGVVFEIVLPACDVDAACSIVDARSE